MIPPPVVSAVAIRFGCQDPDRTNPPQQVPNEKRTLRFPDRERTHDVRRATFVFRASFSPNRRNSRFAENPRCNGRRSHVSYESERYMRIPIGKYPSAWKEINCRVCAKAKMVHYTSKGIYCSQSCSAKGRRKSAGVKHL